MKNIAVRPSAEPINVSIIVDGYGADIRCKNDHLVVRQGRFGSADGLETRIGRGRCSLQRLVILSHEGSISLDALDWLHGQNVSTVGLDSRGRLIYCSTPVVRHDAELRRTQAVSGLNGSGIAQWFVQRKLAAQCALLSRLDGLLGAFKSAAWRAARDRSVHLIEQMAASLPQRLQPLLLAEGQAAQLYWACLQGTAIPWARQSANRIPSHWLLIQPRMMGLEGLSRNSRDPFNSALNLGYSLLESECRIACSVTGLDTDFGFLHVDATNRQSFLYDLMEPLRSAVDELVLLFFFKWRERDTPVKNANFIELRTGVCRLAPELAKQLVEFVQPVVRGKAQDYAEEAMRKIKGAGSHSLRLGQEVPQLQPKPAGRRSPRRETCEYCTGPMRGQGDRFCGRSCFLRWSVEIDRPIEKAQQKLKLLRAEGRDPGHGGAAAIKRSNSNKAAMSKTWSWRRSDAGQEEAATTRRQQARKRREARALESENDKP